MKDSISLSIVDSKSAEMTLPVFLVGYNNLYTIIKNANDRYTLVCLGNGYEQNGYDFETLTEAVEDAKGYDLELCKIHVDATTL